MIPALFLTLAALAPVELRGGDIIDAPVENVSIAGVAIGGPAPRTLSWDRVRAVTGPKAQDARAFTDLAEQAWRARTRLDRSDVRGALELLPELEDRCAGEPGATPLVVFDAALEAHLRAGDHPAALRAFFELTRLIEDPTRRDRHTLDETTGLPTTLAPFLTPDHTARAQQHLTPRDSDTPELARLRAGYRAALQANPDLLPEGGAESPAELLLARITRAVAGDEQALRELRAWANEEPNHPWRRAWTAAAQARAGLNSDDPSKARRAALAYLHIPAFHAASHPYLAGLALTESAAALDRLGETAPANTLRAELARLAPAHPALAQTGDDAP